MYEMAILNNTKMVYNKKLGYSDVKRVRTIHNVTAEIHRLIKL